MSGARAALAALLLVAAIATAPAAEIPSAANLRVSILKTDPSPPEPGRDLLLSLKVDNYGGLAADNVTIILKPRYPFELKPGEAAAVGLGRISQFKEAYVDFGLLVRNDAVEGSYTISTDMCIERCEKGRESNDLDIRVTAAPNVLLTKSEVPSPVGADMEVPVRVTLENVGLGRASKVAVEFGTVPAGSTDRTLFTLVRSPEVAYLGDMAPRSLRNLDLVYRTGERADGVYKLPVTVRYSDATEVTKEFSVAIDVNARPKLTIGQVSVAPARILPGAVVSATIPFTNTGNWPAEDLKLALSTIPVGASGQTTPFGLVDGTAMRSYGTVAPGGGANATFSLLVDPSASGVYTLKAYLTYKGLGTPLEGVVSVPVFGEPRLEAAVRGVSESDGNLVLSVDVMNSGSASANAIVVELAPKDPDVRLVSSPRSLLGSLTPNEIQTVDFTLKVASMAAAASAASAQRSALPQMGPQGQQTTSVSSAIPANRTFSADVSLHYKNAYNQELAEPTSLSFSRPQQSASSSATTTSAARTGSTYTYGLYALAAVGALAILRWTYRKAFGRGED